MRAFRICLYLTLLCLALVTASLADTYAVIVGIDDYGVVDKSLQGCVNDAKAVEQQLTKRGFKSRVLLNGEATKTAVLEALDEGKGSDTVIFYYAGLGSGPSTPRLLMHDDGRGLELEELDQAVLALDAKNTTVILDTCFAGSRAEKAGPSPFKNRYYRPVQPSSRSLTSLGADSSKIPGVSHDQVCYVTASRFSEEAFESRLEGKSHGIFTYFLCERLETGGQLTWRGIQWDVGAKVAAHGEDQQHPLFPARFLASGLDSTSTEGGTMAGRPEAFVATSEGGIPEAKPMEGSLWNLFNLDNEARSMVKISMTPNQAEVSVEQPLTFEVEVGDRPGYLLVVEHSVEGTLRPIFPRDGNLATARVKAGQKIVIPDSETIAYADRPGKERIKAFLFEDSEMAGQLLSGLSTFLLDTSKAPQFGAVSEELRSRSIQFVPAAEFGASVSRDLESGSKVPYTDDIYFQVVPK
jgi:caspase domain-containing protein